MEQEGVIKFSLAFEQGKMPEIDIRDLRAWRRVLSSCGLIGQDVDRYGGLGFGNISMRTVDGFVISGSQTGHLEDPHLESYALVTGWQLDQNVIEARGAVKPSSESLTHAAVYDLDSETRFVFHVHSPSIWQHAGTLDLVQTDPDCEYGTPAMAKEVARVARGPSGVFVMAGHEDGVVAYGTDAETPGRAIVGLLARALACSMTD